MFDYGEDDFRALCAAGPVQAELGGLDDRRRDAVRRFWLWLTAAILGGLAVGALFVAGGLIGMGITFGFIAFFVLLGLAMKPLGKLGRDIKRPILETLAARGGMSYFAEDFAPPVFPDASRILFGRWLSSEVFTDLFQGKDGEGRRCAFYEAVLRRRQGRSTVTIFSGQVYTWQRRNPGHADIAIVPDRGLFNFFKPAPGAQRVKFDDDPEFEKKFEVYATQASEAQMLLGTRMRGALVELRQGGRVFAYIGPGDVLVAVTGKDRFEPGGMFGAKPANERIRAMFDDVCASTAMLSRLREAIG